MPTAYSNTALPVLPHELAQTLKPYISAFDKLVAPAAKRCCWGRCSNRRVAQIARRIEEFLNNALSHPVHPAVTCYALRLCCYLYITHIDESQPVAVRQRQFKHLDRAYALAVALGQYYGTDELRLLELC